MTLIWKKFYLIYKCKVNIIPIRYGFKSITNKVMCSINICISIRTKSITNKVMCSINICISIRTKYIFKKKY